MSLHSIAVVVRRALARRPWLYPAVVVVAAVVGAAHVHDLTERIHATRAAWGETVAVWTATDPIDVGEPLALERADVPTRLVPEGALPGDEPLPDTAARRRVERGEIVVQADVAPADGPLGLVPTGWVAVPVVESVPSGSAIGERVRPATDGFELTDRAIVVGHLDGATLVAVPSDAAPLLAAASGAVTLLRLP